jgi:acyl-coenzyme A thioesterase PaaI-like protein
MSEELGVDNCFVCGKENPIGLKLKFRMEGDTVKSEFTPGKEHEGWNNITHGGIITAVLDDAMAYCIYSKGIIGYTAKIEVRFRKPIHTGTLLRITGKIVSKKKKHAVIRAWAAFQDGEVAAETEGLFSIADTAD